MTAIVRTNHSKGIDIFSSNLQNTTSRHHQRVDQSEQVSDGRIEL